jgi:5'-methylthioadenosine/S-adenosylhomocysteine nucleosidase
VTLILGALDAEIAAVTAAMDGARQDEWRGFPLSTGTLAGEAVVVCRSGVGKTQSAMVSQHLIDLVHPDRLIFTGVAGGLTDELDIGDMVIGDRTVQHDLDVTQMGFPLGQVPYTQYRFLAADPALVALAEQVEPVHGRSATGLILTGDQLIGSATVRDRLTSIFGGLAVEMEGASVALVAAVNDVPFLLLRTISDRSDESVLDFAEILPVAAENSRHYLTTMMHALKEQDK